MRALLISLHLKWQKRREEILMLSPSGFLVSYSSDEFSTTAHLSHPPISQFLVLDNSLLLLVYTIQIIPPMQTQEIEMCQKRKKAQPQ